MGFISLSLDSEMVDLKVQGYGSYLLEWSMRARIFVMLLFERLKRKLEQSHRSFFGKSDLFFVCMLRPVSCEIEMQDSEIEAAQWMTIEEYVNQPYNQEHQLFKCITEICKTKLEEETEVDEIWKLEMENVLGLLRIRVLNLAIHDLGSSDPYVIIAMGNQSLKTRVVKKNCNPEWNEDLTLSVSDVNVPIKLYYIEPVTGRRLRSKKEVQHYLETGEVLKNKRKQETSNSKPDVNCPENSGNQKNKKASKKPRGPEMTFDHENVPEKIECR